MASSSTSPSTSTNLPASASASSQTIPDHEHGDAGPSQRRRHEPTGGTHRWSWWDEVNVKSFVPGGGGRSWECKLCGYTRCSSSNKVRAHFLHEPGNEVRFCPKVTSEKRQELLDLHTAHSTVAAEITRRNVRVAVDPNTMAPATSQRRASPSHRHTPPLGGFSMRQEHSQTSGKSAPPRGRQSTLQENWNPRLKEETDMAVARFFFHDHIAFHVARSPYWKAMVTKIGEYGASYVPPSSETLRTTLLEKEKVSVELAAASIKDLWTNNGVTLVVDGWSDTRKRSIHGVVAYSRGEMYFVDSHDASGSGKSADVLAAEWATTLETIGAENVVNICADGEAANRAAGTILQSLYPHITVSFCMAHCLNNLVKSIGALPWIAPIMEEANKMVTFVLNHGKVRHEFLKRSKLSLLKYSETRFAFNFLMLGRLCTCSGALRGLFLSNEFEAMSEASSVRGLECKALANDVRWWEQAKTITTMIKPVMDLMRLVDGSLPCIGKVYEAMDRMIERLKENVPEDAYEEVQSICVSRWNAYYSPLHAAAYMVDPEFQGCKQEKDKEVSSGFRIILDRLEPDAGKRRKIRDQLQMYREKRGTYGLPDAQQDRTQIGAALWWEDYGADGVELQRFAIRILSQSCSSSCLEQLWSVYSHIASKKRNRLGVP